MVCVDACTCVRCDGHTKTTNQFTSRILCLRMLVTVQPRMSYSVIHVAQLVTPSAVEKKKTYGLSPYLFHFNKYVRGLVLIRRRDALEPFIIMIHAQIILSL